MKAPVEAKTQLNDSCQRICTTSCEYSFSVHNLNCYEYLLYEIMGESKGDVQSRWGKIWGLVNTNSPLHCSVCKGCSLWMILLVASVIQLRARLAQAEDLINVGKHMFHNLEQKPPTKWGDRISTDWCSKHSCLQLLVINFHAPKQKLAQGSSIATFSSSLLRLCPEELIVCYFKKRRKLAIRKLARKS